MPPYFLFEECFPCPSPCLGPRTLRIHEIFYLLKQKAVLEDKDQVPLLLIWCTICKYTLICSPHLAFGLPETFLSILTFPLTNFFTFFLILLFYVLLKNLLQILGHTQSVFNGWNHTIGDDPLGISVKYYLDMGRPISFF